MRLDECKTQFRAQGAGVTTQRHAGAARHDLRHHWNERRQNDRRQDETGPDRRVFERHGPSCHQGQDDGWSRQ